MLKKIVLGIDTRFYNNKPSGIGTYTYELIRELINFKDIELVLFLNKNSPLLIDEYFINTKKIIVNEKLFSINELITFGYKIDKSDINLYHTPSFIMPFLRRKKYVMTIHDLIHINRPEDYTVFHKIYYEFIVKRNAKKASKIITDSEYSKKDLENWLKIDNIVSIPLAHSRNFFPNLGITDLFYKNSINLNSYFIYVGNNKNHKNLKTLLKVYSKIKEVYENYWDLVLVTEKSNELLSLCFEYFIIDNVKFIDKVSINDLAILYSNAKYLILPSLYEGFGLTALEAMACKCPVLMSNVTSLKEIGNNSCLYFSPYNPNEIFYAMEKIFLNEALRLELSNLGFENSKKFSWKKTALETLKIYHQVLNHE
ncbi:MAG: glycosyl transferase [Candidatus Sericytochromatia bacterium]|nr:MAG: glycosyl transferase [Candidatus Sericytochromatia bacterium]